MERVGCNAGLFIIENEISDDVVWIFARANFNLTGRFMKFEEGGGSKRREFSSNSYLIVEKLNFGIECYIFERVTLRLTFTLKFS